jgi:periplasmic protein TonB
VLQRFPGAGKTTLSRSTSAVELCYQRGVRPTAPDTLPTEPLSNAPALDHDARPDDSPIDDERLAEAVAGVATIIPQAPQGLLAPRLRTPLFAACVALALAVHGLGFVAHLLMTWSEGAGGRFAEATGVTIIDADIIDGRDMPDIGGRKDDSSPGDPAPLATASIDRAASRAQPLSQPSAPVPDVTEAKPEPGPSVLPAQETLTTQNTAEMEVAAFIPPPVFSIDTSVPPAIEPANEPKPETPPETIIAERVPDPRPQQAPAEAALEQQASQASLSGDAATAQAMTDTAGNGGIPAATPGEIKTYKTRLGAHIWANRPVARGRPGSVVVTFTLDGEGGIRSVAIKTSSGNADLEAKSLAAIQKAAPFPKPPRGMTGKLLEFEVPIGFRR